jgi:hypothetical protein
MKTLDELKKEEIVLMVELKSNRTQQTEIIKNNFLSILGIPIGAEVEYMERDQRKIGILSSIEVSYGTCYPMVRLYRKDGSLGSRETRL